VNWTAFPVATKPPATVPIALAIVAGFVDACTFLGLFGFFVAQVTGSYVLVGAYPVTGWPGVVAAIAAPVFLAGGVAATLAAIVGEAVWRRPLAAAFALETLLLTGFAATFAAGSMSAGQDTSAVIASMFGLAAMGVQSAVVRLLLRGTAPTNVMTTTTTQIAIDATQLAWTWWQSKGLTPEAMRQREACRHRLWSSLPLPLSFLLGTLAGAIGLTWGGYPVLAAPAAAVGVLTLWAVLATGGAVDQE
jgi:uncharacterized membrane protein YoaK (UPF0700 family)